MSTEIELNGGQIDTQIAEVKGAISPEHARQSSYIETKVFNQGSIQGQDVAIRDEHCNKFETMIEKDMPFEHKSINDQKLDQRYQE